MITKWTVRTLATAVACAALVAIAAAADPTPARAFYAGSGPSEYEVKEGETLFQIAERFLGSAYKAEELAKANKIADPLRVKPGTVIKLPGGAAKPAVRYAIQRLTAAGEVIEHDPAEAMPGSDRFTLRVASNVSGYLYAFNRSRNGNVTRIFPAGRRPARISAFSEYVLPAANYFQLDRARGDEEIWLVVAKEPLTDLDALDEGGELADSRMEEITKFATQKGIIVAGDANDEEGEPDEIVEGRPGNRILLAHAVRIRRK